MYGVEPIRVAVALSHARLLGAVEEPFLHLRTPAPWTIEPLGEQVPDLIVLLPSFEPWARMFPAAGRRPIWQNGRAAIYAPNGGFASIAPPSPAPAGPPVTVQVRDESFEQGRLVFVASFTEHAPDRWTGQDWVVIPIHDEPWAISARFPDQGHEPEVARWFRGLISSGSATTAHTYQLDVPAATLAVRNESGAFVPLMASEGEFGVDSWVLALRLRHEWQPDYWREAAFIPVIQFEVSEAGEVSYAVFDDVLGRVSP